MSLLTEPAYEPLGYGGWIYRATVDDTVPTGHYGYIPYAVFRRLAEFAYEGTSPEEVRVKVYSSRKEAMQALQNIVEPEVEVNGKFERSRTLIVEVTMKWKDA